LPHPPQKPVIPNTRKARVKNLLFSATSEQQVPPLRRRSSGSGRNDNACEHGSFMPVANPVPACAKA
jgi:hypothetical protein